MIAYNEDWLDNINAREQLEKALAENLLINVENEAAAAQFPVGFYSPNIFIRIGLFILTAVVVSFSVGLLALIFLSGSDDAFNGLLIFTGLLCYGALEWFVSTKKHYQSGVDDGLMWCSALLISFGITLAAKLSSQSNALIFFLIFFSFMLRFADRVMALLSMLACMAVLFFIGADMGGIVKALLPFLLMLLSGVFYFVVKKFGALLGHRHYHSGLVIVETAALFCFYLAGNYYVVREAGNSFLGLHLAEGQGIQFGWLFWIFTVTIPVFYIAAGIKTKNIILIRTGTLLIVVMVLTIRFYYHLLPVEIALLFGGLILVGVAYLLTKLLKNPLGGFTSVEAAYNNKSALQNIEAIVIAETLSTQQQAGDDTKFGGGSFGGGGASADY